MGTGIHALERANNKLAETLANMYNGGIKQALEAVIAVATPENIAQVKELVKNITELLDKNKDNITACITGMKDILESIKAHDKEIQDLFENIVDLINKMNYAYEKISTIVPENFTTVVKELALGSVFGSVVLKCALAYSTNDENLQKMLVELKAMDQKLTELAVLQIESVRFEATRELREYHANRHSGISYGADAERIERVMSRAREILDRTPLVPIDLLETLTLKISEDVTTIITEIKKSRSNTMKSMLLNRIVANQTPEYWEGVLNYVIDPYNTSMPNGGGLRYYSVVCSHNSTDEEEGKKLIEELTAKLAENMLPKENKLYAQIVADVQDARQLFLLIASKIPRLAGLNLSAEQINYEEEKLSGWKEAVIPVITSYKNANDFIDKWPNPKAKNLPKNVKDVIIARAYLEFCIKQIEDLHPLAINHVLAQITGGVMDSVVNPFYAAARFITYPFFHDSGTTVGAIMEIGDGVVSAMSDPIETAGSIAQGIAQAGINLVSLGINKPFRLGTSLLIGAGVGGVAGCVCNKVSHVANATHTARATFMAHTPGVMVPTQISSTQILTTTAMGSTTATATNVAGNAGAGDNLLELDKAENDSSNNGSFDENINDIAESVLNYYIYIELIKKLNLARKKITTTPQTVQQTLLYQYSSLAQSSNNTASSSIVSAQATLEDVTDRATPFKTV